MKTILQYNMGKKVADCCGYTEETTENDEEAAETAENPAK